MPENTQTISKLSVEKGQNSVNTPVNNDGTSEETQKKKRERKPLPLAIHGQDTRVKRNIEWKVSTVPESIANADFHLYTPFVIDIESDEMYTKVTKNRIVCLSTGAKFSSNCNGFRVYF